MATVTVKGNPIQTNGELPAVGSQAPAFRLVDADFNEVGLDSFPGKKKILSIILSVDTGVCQASTQRFNKTAASLGDTVVLVVSADLPFALKRFCGAEGIENVKTLSLIRGKKMAKDYGVLLVDGKLAGATARAVVVLDENDKVLHTEMVPEIGQEPNYEAALAALRG